MAFVERDYEDRFGSMGEDARTRDGQMCWISAGAPARNQIAMAASKIMRPQGDVGMNGQSGYPTNGALDPRRMHQPRAFRRNSGDVASLLPPKLRGCLTALEHPSINQAANR
jgi:hypothetical protein